MPDHMGNVLIWNAEDSFMEGFAMVASTIWLEKYADESGFKIVAWKWIEPFEVGE